MIVIDNLSIIGSSNFTDEYSGCKYGINSFIDIN